MSDKLDIDFIIEDLIKQATYERSHFYTATALKLIKEDRQKLQSRNAELEKVNERLKSIIACEADEGCCLMVHDPERQPCDHTNCAYIESQVRCDDCSKPYTTFPLDVALPDQQWKAIYGEGGGVLCANCILKRANMVGATVLLAWIDNMDYDKAREALK